MREFLFCKKVASGLSPASTAHLKYNKKCLRFGKANKKYQKVTLRPPRKKKVISSTSPGTWMKLDGTFRAHKTGTPELDGQHLGQAFSSTKFVQMREYKY